MTLLKLVRQDVVDFLTNHNELMFNERDFQIQLAMYLIQSGKYDVELEYSIPSDVIEQYKKEWGKELRMDILVNKDNEYLPIELKYKTTSARVDILRFGELISDIEVLKKHGAQDLGMYDFWKDVRRIELVRNRFTNVKNGLAVFVTNDMKYLRPSKTTSNNFLFNMDNGIHGKVKHWANANSSTFNTHPDFAVEKEYEISWRNTAFDCIPFKYCIVEI